MSVGHQLNLINNKINSLQTQVDRLEKLVEQINRMSVNNANRISKVEERFKRAAKIAAGIQSRKGPQP